MSLQSEYTHVSYTKCQNNVQYPIGVLHLVLCCQFCHLIDLQILCATDNTVWTLSVFYEFADWYDQQHNY